MLVGYSVQGVPIRLTGERWAHIVEARDELAGRMVDVMDALEQPDWVTHGYAGAKVAWKGVSRGTYLAVVYKEVRRDDGFVVTAFLSTKPKRKQRIWP